MGLESDFEVVDPLANLGQHALARVDFSDFFRLRFHSLVLVHLARNQLDDALELGHEHVVGKIYLVRKDEDRLVEVVQDVPQLLQGF